VSTPGDPLQAVWDALDRHGCQPHGKPHDFRACCPGHDGDNREALHVSVGADGQALVWCFVGCDADTVVAALGLTMADLFPLGHRRARPIAGIARQRRGLDLVLEALNESAITYRATRNPGMWIAQRCPICGAGDWPVWIVEEDEDRRSGRVAVVCLNGCAQADVLIALAGVAA
jgi:hypothetical protein